MKCRDAVAHEHYVKFHRVFKAHKRMYRIGGSQEINSNSSHAFSNAILRLTCGVRDFIKASRIVESRKPLSKSSSSVRCSAVVKIVIISFQLLFHQGSYLLSIRMNFPFTPPLPRRKCCGWKNAHIDTKGTGNVLTFRLGHFDFWKWSTTVEQSSKSYSLHFKLAIIVMITISWSKKR